MSVLRRIARLRVTLGFVCGVVALWLAQPTARSLAIGAIAALAGEAMRIWAAGHLEKGREVTSSGPYGFTRHPLYLGSKMIGVGLAFCDVAQPPRAVTPPIRALHERMKANFDPRGRLNPGRDPLDR